MVRFIDLLGRVKFDLEKFKRKLLSFPVKYMHDFDEFWKRKLKIECGHDHILIDLFREETYNRLCRILSKWQAYRGGDNINPRETLRKSLERISDAYDQIRRYSLLGFNKIPVEPLELIWHELGRVKELNGNRNKYGCYYVIAVCKPLMLLWGQTLAFDTNVRKNMPLKYGVAKSMNRWKFEDWRKVMVSFQKDLLRNPEFIEFLKEESLKRYGTDSVVPYGRFLDIYYY
ncbi:MAG: hypothetical protein J7L07_00020 [Candidatus Odinarchaeota archaeon]|nr:hypothetical protein [Candidatus Odinarchaeota archaeon]